jgi:hypothetical protein
MAGCAENYFQFLSKKVGVAMKQLLCCISPAIQWTNAG